MQLDGREERLKTEEQRMILERLTYQIQLLGNTIDSEEYPLEALALRLKWSEEDFDKAEEILDKYDHLWEKSPKMPLHELEMELRRDLKTGYQEVKWIILAFHKSGHFEGLCEEYARQHQCSEFRKLLADNPS